MYMRFRKLLELQVDSLAVLTSIERRIDALAIAINALSLVEGKNPFIVVPAQNSNLPVRDILLVSRITTNKYPKPRKRRKVGGHIPEDKFSTGRRNVDIVNLTTMKQEYAHLLANAEVLRRDLSSRSAGKLFCFVSVLLLKLTYMQPIDLSSPWVTVSKLTQAGQFELAMSTAKTLSVDMSELFQRLALQCVQLSSDDDLGP